MSSTTTKKFECDVSVKDFAIPDGWEEEVAMAGRALHQTCAKHGYQLVCYVVPDCLGFESEDGPIPYVATHCTRPIAPHLLLELGQRLGYNVNVSSQSSAGGFDLSSLFGG